MSQSQDYLFKAAAYIELNPVKAKMVKLLSGATGQIRIDSINERNQESFQASFCSTPAGWAGRLRH